MRRRLVIVLFAFVVLAGVRPAAAQSCAQTYGTGSEAFSLATGSPGELDLLKALAEGFAKERPGMSLCWIKAGSGEALAMLKAGKTDMVMSHSPAMERKALEEGWGANRALIGSNEFYLVGPAADPAGVAQAGSAADAFARVAKAKAVFVSRGDDSGTHKKEMEVWKKAGVEPAGDWYVVTKSFMLDALRRADAMRGYFMTDSSTWAAASQELPNLKILYRGDPFLINVYHALTRPDGASPGQPAAKAFAAYAASEAGQRVIREFGRARHGEGLYNDAAYAAQYDK